MNRPYKTYRHRLNVRIMTAIACACLFRIFAIAECFAENPVAYDIDRACEICDSMPLGSIEGIWLYPDDNVTILVLKTDGISPTALPEFEISVVETTECNMRPGEKIGIFRATADPKKFSMELYTEREKGLLSKPKSCVVTLGNEEETLMLPKKSKSGLNLRFSLNPTLLLPRMWRIIRFGTSSRNTQSDTPPIGLVKIYPSYDGNGSSRRKIRYL